MDLVTRVVPPAKLDEIVDEGAGRARSRRVASA